MESKNPLQSKTVWVNAVMGVAPLVPGLSDWIQHNPEGFGMVFGLVNVAVRFLTTKKLSFDWKF